MSEKISEEIKDILGTEKRKPGRPPAVKAVEESAKDFANEESSPTEETVTISKSELNELKKLLEFAKKAQPANITPEQEGVSTVDLISQFTQALKDVRKPYKSEADLENEKRQREQSKQQERIKRLNIEAEQADCTHMAGHYPGSRERDETAIVWHEVHSHFWIGICTACNRKFWPNDPDYRYWRNKRSYNTQSESGDRMISAEAVQAWAAKEHPEPFGKASGYEISTDRPSWIRK
jgi:hypothetical protein